MALRPIDNKAIHTCPIVVHMGYVRTGTTMHQRHIFAAHEDIHYIGKPFADGKVLKAFRNLACQDWATFDEHGSYEVMRESALPRFQNARCVVLSDEIILSPYSVEIGTVLMRLQRAFGDIKALVTIREQFTAFQSWIEHVMPKREYGSIDSLLRYHLKFKNTQKSLLSFLDYYAYYDFLRTKLGKDRVLMLPYELIRADKQLYCELLAKFLNVSQQSIVDRLNSAPMINSGQARWEIAFENFRKHHTFKAGHPMLDRFGKAFFRTFPIGGRRIDAKMQELRAIFTKEFAPKNVPLRKALLDDIGVDIAGLGYSLPKHASSKIQIAGAKMRTADSWLA